VLADCRQPALHPGGPRASPQAGGLGKTGLNAGPGPAGAISGVAAAVHGDGGRCLSGCPDPDRTPGARAAGTAADTPFRGPSSRQDGRRAAPSPATGIGPERRSGPSPGTRVTPSTRHGARSTSPPSPYGFSPTSPPDSPAVTTGPRPLVHHASARRVYTISVHRAPRRHPDAVSHLRGHRMGNRTIAESSTQKLDIRNPVEYLYIWARCPGSCCHIHELWGGPL
jgi:hypothetical protein